jgi:hypothetical protein
MELHNPAHGGANDIVVSASLRYEQGGCWKIIVEAHSTTNTTVATASYPVFLVGRTVARTRLGVVPGSTILDDERGHRIASLNDTIASSTVAIPYTMDGATIWFVNFSARIR